MDHSRKKPKPRKIPVNEAHLYRSNSSSPLEKESAQALRFLMLSKGWMVRKTHGSKFSSDWPDLFCAHPEYGIRWIETKSFRENHKLSSGQVQEFIKWAKYGVGVWVLRGPQDYPLLFEPSNWRFFM